MAFKGFLDIACELRELADQLDPPMPTKPHVPTVKLWLTNLGQPTYHDVKPIRTGDIILIELGGQVTCDSIVVQVTE